MMVRTNWLIILIYMLNNSDGNCQDFECLSVEDTVVFQKQIEPNSERLVFTKTAVQYYASQDLLGEISLTGDWTCQNDTIKVDFELKPRLTEGNLSIRYGSSCNEDDCLLKFVDTDGDPLVGSTVRFNGKTYYLDNLEATIRLKSMFIDSLEVVHFKDTYKLRINNELTQNVEIVLKPSEWREAIYEYVPSVLLIRPDGLVDVRNLELNFIYKKLN